MLPSELTGLIGKNAIKAALIANANDTSVVEGSKITDKVLENKTLAALSGAWFWGTHNVPGGVALNDKASSIIWNSNEVNPNQENEFLNITKGVNGGTHAADDRWDNYKANVNALLDGGNPFESMREVLARLGVTTVTGKDYSQQFGISLAVRKPVDIVGSGTNNLMATTGEVLSETPDGPDLTVEQQAKLWAQAEPLLVQLKQSTEEKSAMFVPDIWPISSLLVSAAVTVAASPVQAADNYVLGRCSVAQPDSGAQIRPASGGDSYLYRYHADDPRYQGFSFNSSDTKVTLVKAPAHGKVEHAESRVSTNNYHYMPNEGYFGQDMFVMQVEKNGVKVRIHYLMEVVHGDEPTTYIGDDGERHGQYCNPDSWKISSTTSTLDYARLQALLGATNISNSVAVTFSDLVGGALGQTTGNSIALDTNAAGHNWFIDPTPLDNTDEFLPTSNPNEWIAKAGTEAASKMDMLSVLLHEYGHALGFEHSTNAHDFMATTLTPGVRRLPTAEELALMAQLVAEIKTDMVAASNTPDTPQSPFPTLPLDSILGLALFGRLRGTRFGGVTTAIDSAKLIQYDIAANPTFTNNQLQSTTGWATTGNVTIANGDAVLTETATTQTRLNQVFVVGPTDRFLSFTLAGINLDDQSAAPDDAFEAALIDANTGLSLLGSTGLTHNDAFLNLQADGSEHKASGITSVVNADGSRTYLVDLTGIQAGTAVNLSFDLLGFGTGTAATGSPNSSHLTIRNLALSQAETKDDSLTLNEDTPTVIAVLANDLLPVGAGDTPFAPRLVAAPIHGQVFVNADGSFSYTPEANYHGTDSFTYRVSNGQFESNIATVSLTIAPINDAPLASDATVSVVEDGSSLIDLVALASDVDSDSTSLVASIVAAPQHGQVVVNADGSFSYTAAADYNGTDSFTYKVNDGELDSNIATVTLIVTAVNDAPVATDASVTLSEDVTSRIDLVGFASDIDSATLTALIVTDPTHGSLTQNTDGSFTYTPDANYNGTDSFSYKVNDGELDSNLATVALTVAAMNDAAVASDAIVSLVEDGSSRIDLVALASDIDSATLTASIVAGPQHGQVSLNADGSFTYTPEADYNGTDSFTYRVNDGEIDSNVATVTLIVTAVNDAAVATDASVTLLEDGTRRIDLVALTSDIDSTVLNAVIVTGPTHGALTQNADPSTGSGRPVFVYTPEANYNGTDSFTYKVNDGELDSNIATVALSVPAVNDAAVASDAAFSLAEDGTRRTDSGEC